MFPDRYVYLYSMMIQPLLMHRGPPQPERVVYSLESNHKTSMFSFSFLSVIKKIILKVEQLWLTLHVEKNNILYFFLQQLWLENQVTWCFKSSQRKSYTFKLCLPFQYGR